jgi:hypothetical protein
MENEIQIKLVLERVEVKLNPTGITFFHFFPIIVLEFCKQSHLERDLLNCICVIQKNI